MSSIKGWAKVKPDDIIPKTPHAYHQWVHEKTGRRITIYPLRITVGANPFTQNGGKTRRVHGTFIVAKDDGSLISGIAGQGLTVAIKIARDYIRDHPEGIRRN
jgi:hypothetical protein